MKVLSCEINRDRHWIKHVLVEMTPNEFSSLAQMRPGDYPYAGQKVDISAVVNGAHKLREAENELQATMVRLTDLAKRIGEILASVKSMNRPEPEKNEASET